jgi:cytidine deaminase
MRRLSRPARRAVRVREDEAVRELLRHARAARRRALATYSGFKVGAALRARGGLIVTGCNVENATYGLTVCAERVAVWKAVSEGLRHFEAIAVVADSRRPSAPCGPCRQILWELCGDILVYVADRYGLRHTLRLSELLPLPFDKRNL